MTTLTDAGATAGPQRRVDQLLAHYEESHRHPRNEAIARAYLSGRHTMAEIAKHFGIHYTTVSRLLRSLMPLP